MKRINGSKASVPADEVGAAGQRPQRQATQTHKGAEPESLWYRALYALGACVMIARSLRGRRPATFSYDGFFIWNEGPDHSSSRIDAR